MATLLTGQKLPSLGVLALGSTGTMFYAVSAAGNSYKMYEKDLYTTLNTLHLSGVYQQKNEDWRFVHKTGNEYITGAKRFANVVSVDTVNSYLHLGSADSPIVQIRDGTLFPNIFAGISLDWSGRRLSGNWNAESLTINNQHIGTGNEIVYTTGSQSIAGIKTFTSNIALQGNITDGSDNIVEISNRKLNDDNPSASLDWQNKHLLFGGGDSSITLDWNNKILSGNWNAGSLKVVNGIGFWGSGTPAARPVITGSRGANVALASLLTGLHYIGIVNNQTTI